MRRLLLSALFLLPCPAWATWGNAGNTTQTVFKNDCAASTSCTVTVTAIGAGHFLYVVGHTGNTTNLSSVTAAGETFTVVTGGGNGTSCPFNGGGNTTQFGCAYVLSSVGGATTVTCNWSGTATASNTTCGVYEIPFTAQSVFAESNAINHSNTAAVTFSGANFGNNYPTFINGANDVCFQSANVASGTVASIDSSYVLDNHTGQVADAHILNTFSNTPPTWTNSGSAASLVNGMCFGENFTTTSVAFPQGIGTMQVAYDMNGQDSTQELVVTSTGLFKLVFEHADNWGISQWYDLVNDPGATTNLTGPAYPSGSCALGTAEPGLFNRTYYDFTPGDSKQCTRSSHTYFPNAPRALNVLEYNSSRVVVETTSIPAVSATGVLSNMTTVIRYYIYPNGQIYVHCVSTLKNAANFTNNIYSDVTLEDPTRTVALPPDTQGWIRASATQNPYTNAGPETYVFAYWGPSTPAPYTSWTKASILLVHSPSNTHDNAEIQHAWSSCAGFGVVRWGWSSDAQVIVVGAGGTETEDMLIQLGTQGSGILPNITSSAVAGPIATAYINNPNPPNATQLSSVVSQGASVTFTTNLAGTLTWALSGTDSSSNPTAGLGSINSSTGIYTAPGSVTSQQSYAGYQLTPNNHIYNTRIDSLSVDANSAAWITSVGTQRTNYLPMMRPNYVDASTPTAPMIFQYTSFANGAFQVPQDTVSTTPYMECGWLKQQIVSGSGACDRHWWAIDSTNGNFQEGYFLFNGTAGTWTNAETLADCPSAGLTTCTAVSGVRYANSTYVLPAGASTDAAGLYIMPLVLRAQEFEQALATGGTIKHALRFTLQNGYICGSSVANACGQNATGTRHIWPATSEAFAGGGSIPYGARLRLKAAYDISSFSAGAQILLTQLKQYGMMLADGGTGWQISTEANNDAALAAAVAAIFSANITAANFEFVNEQALLISSSSGEATSNRETVAVTSSAGSSSTEVVLTGVTVGLPNDNLTIQAGMSAQQFTAYVHGGATNTVTWTMSPTVGTLTSAGLYTPPATVASPTTTTVKATSVDTGTVAASMTVLVLPTGVIRLTTSLTGQYTDTGGNTWWPNLDPIVTEGSLAVSNGGSFPATPNITLYKKPAYATNDISDDMTFSFLVPNGNYLVTGKFLDNRGSSCVAGTSVTRIEAQAVVRKASQDVCSEAGGHNQPLDFITTVTVTNNRLTYVVRNMGSSPVTVSTGEPFISALSIDSGVYPTLTPNVKVTSGMTVK